jgi:hypothetical protein
MSATPIHRHTACTLAAALLTIQMVFAAAAVQAVERPSGSGSHADLVALFAEFQDWRDPPLITDTRPNTVPESGALPDYSPETIARRVSEMEDYQQRLADMAVADWQRGQQVDWVAVRGVMDEYEFILKVTRPWARDPNFYVEQLLSLAFTELPVSGSDAEILRSKLEGIPGFLAAAKAQLTDAASDYADYALFNLSNEDNVNPGHPQRPLPPAGLIGWYEDLLARTPAQPELTPLVQAALDAIRDYRDWIQANRASMTARAGVGPEKLDWFLRHVKMIPYSAVEAKAVAKREVDRQRAFLALERHRNRKLPEIELPENEAEYLQRLAATDAKVRKWMVEESIIDLPDFVPSDWRVMGYNVPWVERQGPPNFWEQIQYRDPMPDHLHAVIPGHRFDGWMERHNDRPIRGAISFGDRREGWGLYLEEAAVQLGLMQDRPRTRELIYAMGLWRALRTYGDLHNQRNEWTMQETMDYWMREAPWMDRGVAGRYAYLRPSPGTSLHYTMGMVQMVRLLSDRYLQLGDDFVLKDFHDDFMARGRIPISLIRWDMTGLEDDLDMFFKRTPVDELLD